MLKPNETYLIICKQITITWGKMPQPMKNTSWKKSVWSLTK